jgi:hypothetical protein
MFTQKKKKRSTLPAVRRAPGQSLREEWDRLVNERLLFIIIAPCMLWFVWFSHWPEIANSVPAKFWLFFAIAGTVLGAADYWRLIPRARGLVRGERGEMRVAEVLEDLRAAGYRPFHDLKRDGFNIDHVLVGPAGVFAIETKFRSGEGEITFRNGEGLFIGDFPDERDCLKQARSNAREVNRLIKENCGLNEWVWPLVVFVGDWKVRNDWRSTDARVFTTDTLVRHIANRQPELTRREIELIASHLERSAKS